MGITVLGPLTVDGSGRLGPRDRVVLQALATRQGRPVSAEELMDALWGDHPPASAAKNLQSCILDEGELGIDGKHLDYSPDGRHAAVSGSGGEVLVLDLQAGAPLRPPAVIANEVIDSVTYSADGARILAAGGAASVSLLDGRTGLLLARVLTPQHNTAAVFREDPESVLISTYGDGPVWLWDTDVDHAVEFACRVAGRDFTKAEWTAQFGSRPYQETCPGR